MKTKQRNAEVQRKKQERLKAKEDEELKKVEMNKTATAQSKSRIEIAKLQKLGKNQSKANETRLEKTVIKIYLKLITNNCIKDAMEMISQAKQEVRLKNYGKKKEIQDLEREALEKKKRDIVRMKK